MNGKELFKIAVRSMEEISRQALDEAGVTIDQVSLVIPHHNKRIIGGARRAARRADGKNRGQRKIRQHVVASIPVALDEAKRAGRIRPGDIVLLNAFGAGFAWGAAVVKF
jgi:3-oxoacyl-[acyl-carrier-protein] synthase-3